jgi:hypothetical protein
VVGFIPLWPPFSLAFQLAAVQFLMFGVDFLRHFFLLVNLAANCLVDPFSKQVFAASLPARQSFPLLFVVDGPSLAACQSADVKVPSGHCQYCQPPVLLQQLCCLATTLLGGLWATVAPLMPCPSGPLATVCKKWPPEVSTLLLSVLSSNKLFQGPSYSKTSPSPHYHHQATHLFEISSP